MDQSNICGLNNIGNTCFMNSALQMLVNCTVLSKFILNNEFKSLKLNCYKKFLADYFSNNVITPLTVKNMVSENNSLFSGFQQQDAHEFLISIIDIIQEEFKKEYKDSSQEILGIKNNKLVDVILDTNITSIIYCEETSDKSKTKIGEKVLSLPIPRKKNISLDDCIEKFTEIEKLSGDSQWLNDKDNNYYDAYKRLYIKSYPKYLIIHLKRFDYTYGANKISNPIRMNEKIILKNDTYRLRSIVFHMGNVGGGHYINILNKNNKWYVCNDSSVSEINNVNKYLYNGYIYLYAKDKK